MSQVSFNICKLRQHHYKNNWSVHPVLTNCWIVVVQKPMIYKLHCQCWYIHTNTHTHKITGKTAPNQESGSDQPSYHNHMCWTPLPLLALVMLCCTSRNASSQQITSQWHLLRSPSINTHRMFSRHSCDPHDITDTGTFKKRPKSVLFDRAHHWLLLALLDVSYSGAQQI